MKVKANGVYEYRPAFLDMIDARTTLQAGDKVRVVNLPGCPKCNTMGHCHVETLQGEFIGMVQTASLEKSK
jgi:hypothetical protein